MGVFRLYDNALTGLDMSAPGWGLTHPDSMIAAASSPSPNVGILDVSGNPLTIL